MISCISGIPGNRMGRGSALALVLALAGCAPAPVSNGIHDPDEAQNREAHEFNVELDTYILKPLSTGLAGDGNGLVLRGVHNFTDNVALPGSALNNLLQLRFPKAGENTVRFVLNTVIGLGGLLDPATVMGVPEDTTDFGETLFVWGVGEGAYDVVPFIGPSTTRDTIGVGVDTLIDPLFLLVGPYGYIPTIGKLTTTVGDRARYSDTVDSILYESADGYAQARLLYLQHRRFELGQTSGEATFEDPYEDPYGQ